MLPDRALMYVAAIEDRFYIEEKKQFWKDVYGINMQCMTNGIYVDPQVANVPGQHILSDSCCVLDLDLMNMKPEDVEYANSYSLEMKYSNNVHGLVAWFDAKFSNLKRPAILTTSPKRKHTHWKQTIFYLKKSLEVKKGDRLTGSIACRKDRINFRELNIKISYHMDGRYCKSDTD